METSSLGVHVVDVIVDVPGSAQEIFTYLVPSGLEDQVKVGSCVVVPFGRQEVLGYVARRYEVSGGEVTSLKPLIEVVEGSIPLSEERLRLAEWIAQEYVCSLGAAVRLLAPTEMVARVQRVLRLTALSAQQSLLLLEGEASEQRLLELLQQHGGQMLESVAKARLGLQTFQRAVFRLKRRGIVELKRVVEAAEVRPRLIRHVALAIDAPQALVLAESLERRAPAQSALLRALAVAERTMLPMAELLRQVGVSQSALRSLQAKGAVVIQDVPVLRSPLVSVETSTAPSLRLTVEQERSLERIMEAIDSGRGGSFLLFGVTGSGKTEVYLRAVAHTLARGRSALLLVPEIALAAQVVEAVSRRFGRQVAVFHSALSPGERFDEWRRALERRVQIVVGARSAVFAPLEQLGLIVLDEEHEGAYKQQEHAPRYHARTIAWWRAQHERAVLLMGSATPSVETFYEAQQGRHELLQLSSRVEGRPLPTVHLVDLRSAPRTGTGLFSQQMAEAIGERLRRGEQVILFLNRRAYGSFVLCRQCGYVAKCRRCEVSLAYHKVDHSLRCHHCDFRQPMAERCPSCGAQRLYPFGLGTQRVEEELRRLFPGARLLRMDRDTTSRKGAHHVLLARFRAREADILIGTQMVAKGLDFPEVTLVGVVSADTALHLPDFRAGERAFQLLTQVAGRSGRGEKAGEVIIQTFNPEHEAIRAACRQDYLSFYEQEIAHRAELGYPPFSRLANVVVQHAEATVAEQTCCSAVQRLAEVVRSEGIAAEILGPVQAPIARLRGLWRWHALIKCYHPDALPLLLSRAMKDFDPPSGAGLHVDIDPYSLL